MNIFLIFFIFCNVTAGAEKIISSDLMHNLVIQTGKCSLFKEKVYSPSFHDAPITPFEALPQGKTLLFHAPS